MSKVTIQDLAKASGLSTATVDRVLNGRSGVSVRARRLVKKTAVELGYGQLDEDFLRNSRGRVSLQFILPPNDTPLVRKLTKGLLAASSKLPEIELLIDIQRCNFLKPEKTAAAIYEACESDCDGIGVFAIDANSIQEAFATAAAKGKKLATLVSDISGATDHFYSGIDNGMAGRTAAQLVGQFSHSETGHVAVVCDRLDSRDQAERYIGFREVLQRDHKNLRLLPSIEGLRDPDRIQRELVSLFSKYPDLEGLYSIGGGNKEIINFLKSRPAHRPVVIMHDITEDTRSGLKSKIVAALISQDESEISLNAVNSLVADVLKEKAPSLVHPLSCNIFLSENLPD